MRTWPGALYRILDFRNLKILNYNFCLTFSYSTCIAACNCHVNGGKFRDCQQSNGNCICTWSEYAGLKCDGCENGYEMKNDYCCKKNKKSYINDVNRCVGKTTNSSTKH